MLFLLYRDVSFRFRWIKGSAILLFISLLACWRTGQVDRVPPLDFNRGEAICASGILEASQRTQSGRWKATLLLDQIDSIRVNPFKLLLYFPDSAQQPEFGHRILFKATLRSISSPKNPYAFDYSQYLRNQSIHGQVFLRSGQWVILDSSDVHQSTLFMYQLRESIRDKLDGFTPQNQPLLEALILGDKSGLDPAVKEAFAKSGALHVLAVSGLHVGLVYTLLGGLAQFLFRRFKRMRWMETTLVLAGIWLFVGVSGASASVCRAGTMFSFFVLGQQLGRRGNGFNSLAGAGFCLLVMNPLLVFQAGFQLSFTAVWGILFFQRRIYGVWKTKHWLLDQVWVLV
ncbi:MAG: ComEC/Rec2 family competence protein, partial [Bacteroidota bacterium]